MEKTTAKGFDGVFLNLNTGLAVTLLATTICVLSFIAGISYANANGQLTLPRAAVTEADTVSQPASNESGRGTQNTIKGVSEPRIKTESEQSGEWLTVKMRVTAYCPCPKCCGEYSDGETACGHKIRPGDAFVAADKKYSFGTEMIIAGYKNGEPVKVLDRGGVIRGNRLDVFFHSHEEALKWGVRYLNVKVRRK